MIIGFDFTELVFFVLYLIIVFIHVYDNKIETKSNLIFLKNGISIKIIKGPAHFINSSVTNTIMC